MLAMAVASGLLAVGRAFTRHTTQSSEHIEQNNLAQLRIAAVEKELQEKRGAAVVAELRLQNQAKYYEVCLRRAVRTEDAEDDDDEIIPSDIEEEVSHESEDTEDSEDARRETGSSSDSDVGAGVDKGAESEEKGPSGGL